MKVFPMYTCVVLATVVAVLLLSGCGGPPKTAGEVTGDLSGPRFETVWVDPQIVVSDTLISLIKAGRVDSVMLEADEVSTRPPASIEFAVETIECNVVVNLLDAYGQIVMPLFVRRLPSGYYRLTVHSGAERGGLLPGPYLLEADVCDQKRRAEIRLN